MTDGHANPATVLSLRHELDIKRLTEDITGMYTAVGGVAAALNQQIQMLMVIEKRIEDLEKCTGKDALSLRHEVAIKRLDGAVTEVTMVVHKHIDAIAEIEKRLAALEYTVKGIQPHRGLRVVEDKE